MPYIVVAVETGVPWTTAETTVQFSGRTLTLRPGSKTLYPTVVVEYEPDTEEAWASALGDVRRCLSALAWSEQSYIRTGVVSGGGFPIQIGRSEVGEVTVLGKWRADHLPEPADESARRALAFYREANGLEHFSIPYAFLGYTKILNIKLATGRDQIAWINQALLKINDHCALERLTELRSSTANIGEYLYGSGRCAVAHAFGETVNPDDVGDTLRLTRDLPVVKALAEHFIEHELHVESLSTFYSEHLYELEGFRTLFGADLVAEIKKGNVENLAAPNELPILNVRLDLGDREPDEIAFSRLHVGQLGVSQSVAVLYCVSADRRLHLAIGLDFANERLAFNPERSTKIVDDGTAEVIDHAIMRARFFRGMLMNGRTEIYNAETGERLGRTDAFIGTNIDLYASLQNLDGMLSALRAERDRRIAGTQADVAQ